MKISKNLISVKAIAGMTVIAATLTTSFFVAPANAQRVCWCTDYIANRFGLSGYPDAGDWDNGYLQSRGFVRVGAQPGAIVVMERSFPGSNTSAGHIGIVESIFPDGRISVRGGHQTVGNALFNEAGCSNVRITTFLTPAINNPNVSFWVRGNNPNIRLVNFSALAAPEGVNIRSGTSTNAPIVGRATPNQRLNFDAWTYGDSVADRWINTPDARWYRIAGTNNWVASALVNGNAPGSSPRP